MTENEKINIGEIFDSALKDPELLSSLDIDGLLSSLENDKNDYLENKTIKSVAEEIYEKINEFDIPKETKLNYCKKLSEYRFVNNIHELHKGKYIRFIRLPQPENERINDANDELSSDSEEEDISKNKNVGKLMLGGIVVNIRFTDYGTYVVLLSPPNFYFNLKYDNFYIFQKMNMNEQLILMAYEHLERIK